MQMNGSARPLLVATATVFAIALLSVAVWNYFERPVQRWLRTFLAMVATKFAAKDKTALANS
jgi:peptidoglycan/LPS O-acetylase OafA/YrhL